MSSFQTEPNAIASLPACRDSPSTRPSLSSLREAATLLFCWVRRAHRTKMPEIAPLVALECHSGGAEGLERHKRALPGKVGKDSALDYRRCYSILVYRVSLFRGNHPEKGELRPLQINRACSSRASATIGRLPRRRQLLRPQREAC